MTKTNDVLLPVVSQIQNKYIKEIFEMKKIVSILTTITLLTGAAATTASALTPSTFATDIAVYLNGENVYAGSDNQPCIMNDRTMVQIRPIFEKLGYTAEYDDATKTAVFYGGIENMPVSFTDDSYKVTVLNSEGGVERTVDIDVPATNYNGSFYVPLRAFCEIVSGLTIDWDSAARRVDITSNKAASTIVIDDTPTVSYLSKEEAKVKVQQWLADSGKWSEDYNDENLLVVSLNSYNGKEYYQLRLVEPTEKRTINLGWYAISKDGSEIFEGTVEGDVIETF